MADEVEGEAEDGAVAVAQVLDGDGEAVAVLDGDAGGGDLGEVGAVGEEEGGAWVGGEALEGLEELALGLAVEALVVELAEPGEALGEGDSGVEEGDVAGEAGVRREEALVFEVAIGEAAEGTVGGGERAGNFAPDFTFSRRIVDQRGVAKPNRKVKRDLTGLTVCASRGSKNLCNARHRDADASIGIITTSPGAPILAERLNLPGPDERQTERSQSRALAGGIFTDDDVPAACSFDGNVPLAQIEGAHPLELKTCQIIHRSSVGR